MRVWGIPALSLALLFAGPVAAATFEAVRSDANRSVFLDTSNPKVSGEQLELTAYSVNEPPWKGWAAVERMRVRIDCEARTITELEVAPLGEDLQPLPTRPRALETFGLGGALNVCHIPSPPIAVAGYIDRIAKAGTLQEAVEVARTSMSSKRREPAGYRARFLPRDLVSLPHGPLRLVADNSSGVFFVDEARTHRNGDIVDLIELLVRHPNLRGTTALDWQFVVWNATIDCRARTVFTGPAVVFMADGTFAEEYPQDVRNKGAVKPSPGDVGNARLRVLCDGVEAKPAARVTGYEAALGLVEKPETWQPLKVRSD